MPDDREVARGDRGIRSGARSWRRVYAIGSADLARAKLSAMSGHRPSRRDCSPARAGRLAELRRAARRATSPSSSSSTASACRPAEFGGPWIDALFTNALPADGASLFRDDPAPARVLARADRARRRAHAVRAVRPARLARGHFVLARPRRLQRFLDRHRARGHRRGALRRAPVRRRSPLSSRRCSAPIRRSRRAGSPGTATSRPGARPIRGRPSTGGGSSTTCARAAPRSAARCSPEARSRGWPRSLLAACAAREPPPAGERIVSVAPNLTEMLFAAGAGGPGRRGERLQRLSGGGDGGCRRSATPSGSTTSASSRSAPTVAVVWETGTPAGVAERLRGTRHPRRQHPDAPARRHRDRPAHARRTRGHAGRSRRRRRAISARRIAELRDALPRPADSCASSSRSTTRRSTRSAART